MSTPEENFEIATDGSNELATRAEAIDWLEAANECDMLAELARMNDLDDRLREEALTYMAHPPCEQLLRTVADGGDLPASLQEQAETLLRDTPDDAGASP
ncbi:hypothetical protein [Halobacterium zhouii]|uniref:hypothetical protein n=1 Tax=Halobacterium zhouii TaxID=2902624 RepID=UPI001E5C7C0A|nr:hypothetical protein [Halobacterium zhouii]